MARVRLAPPATALIICLMFAACMGKGMEDTPDRLTEEERAVSASAPSSSAEESAPPGAASSQAEPEEDAPPEQRMRFAIPQSGSPSELEEELIAVVQGFSKEFKFPAFSSVRELDYASFEVSSNVFFLALTAEDAAGRTTPEVRDRIAELIPGGYSFASVHAMNAVGRTFFGGEFSFPPGLECGEIIAVEGEPEFYVLKGGRGGMSYFYYLLIEATEEDGVVTAEFLPYNPLISWEDGTVIDIAFLDADTGLLSYDLGILEYPDDDCRQAATVHSCLEYCDLLVPQEMLVTLRMELLRDGEDGLMVRSAVYN